MLCLDCVRVNRKGRCKHFNLYAQQILKLIRWLRRSWGSHFLACLVLTL